MSVVSNETCYNEFFVLFDLLLGKQLRSYQDDQLLNHTVPGQASKRQSTSI